MSRLLWVGVGAAGGIYGYRRSQRAWQRAKDRGVVGTATLMAATTTSALQTLRATVAAQGSDAAGPAGPVRAARPAAGSSARPSAVTLG